MLDTARFNVLGAVIFALAFTGAAHGQVTIFADDTPLAIPDGATVLSDLDFTAEGTVEDLEIWVAVTFEQPQGSGLFIDLLGPNAVDPPGSGLFLASPGGGDLYMRITMDAPSTCNDLCGSSGCGSPASFVTCRSFDDLSPFIGESSGATWQLRVGNGPPNGPVLESWALTLSGTGELASTIFEDGFESGDAERWSAVESPLVADFSFEVDADQMPGTLDVTFTDESTGAPTSWSWDFGDGSSSTERNPVRVFQFAGTYSVGLTVFRDGLSTTTMMAVTVP